MRRHLQAVTVVIAETDDDAPHIPLASLGKVALFFGNDAQLVVGAGGAMLVALLFINGEGFAIPLLGLGKVALFFGNLPSWW